MIRPTMIRPTLTALLTLALVVLLGLPSAQAAHGEGGRAFSGRGDQWSGEGRRRARPPGAVVRGERGNSRRVRPDVRRIERGRPRRTQGDAPRRANERGDRSSRRDVAVSRDRAASIARSATGGRVLSLSLRGNGRPWYRVKVLTPSGRVRSVAVDARTGAVGD
jgi:hypothetical protein